MGMLPNFKSALQLTGIQIRTEDRDPGKCWTVLAEIFQIIQHETDV